MKRMYRIWIAGPLVVLTVVLGWATLAAAGIIGTEPWQNGGGSYLGVDVREVTPERVAALKLKEERGVEVTLVDQEAPAGKAGLKAGDVILEFNGARVESVEQLKRMLRETPPGRTATLGIWRDGQMITANPTLADREKVMAYVRPKGWPKGDMKIVIPKLPDIPDFEMPAIDVVMQTRWRNGGLVVENLSTQLGEYFGVKAGQGVLVRSVEKGSPAEAAGFKAGDVIVQAGKEKIEGMSDWRHALRQHKEGPLSVNVIREKKPVTLSLNIPQRRRPRREVAEPPEPPEPPDSSELLFEMPDIDVNVDLGGLQEEIERMQPAFERIRYEMASNLTEALEENREELERAAEEVRRILECEKKRLHQEAERMRENIKVETW